MRIFVSWSGASSRVMAEGFHGWLPLVLQGSRPWLSTEDIRKGTLWQAEITEALKPPAAGIFCLTRESLASDWLHVEAGAILNAAGPLAVCTYLIDFDKLDPVSPLAMFQSSLANRADTLRMIRHLNRIAPAQMSEELLTTLFETFWPRLASTIEAAGGPRNGGRRK